MGERERERKRERGKEGAIGPRIRASIGVHPPSKIAADVGESFTPAGRSTRRPVARRISQRERFTDSPSLTLNLIDLFCCCFSLFLCVFFQLLKPAAKHEAAET